VSHLLEVKDLCTHFKTYRGLVNAVDQVSFYVDEGEIVGFVGESGCGKTVTQLSVLQLIPTPPGKVIRGEAFFEGCDLLKLNPKGAQMRSIRGAKIAMIFQEPMTSLNPVLTLNRQLSETAVVHLKMSKKEARAHAITQLGLVGIPRPAERIDEYPHQFSGGMRQRVMIAMALSCNPKILIADEPTTALDVTTQAQVLELMREMVDRFQAALVLVTHNLGVIARYAQRVYVMYAGRIVESGHCREIFRNPRHPYTMSLLMCLPRLDESTGRELLSIPGAPPNLIGMSGRCAFLPRCPYHVRDCEGEPWPELRRVADQHFVSCYVEMRETNGNAMSK
jgi:oligopeptide/dipeptide ABC transporter ATP-binding protein